MDDEPVARGSAADLAGTTIGGRYRLVELIATGGMARVFRAVDEVLARSVAVKILHVHLLADDAFVERFRHEAIAAARLSHPSIVSIYDTVSEDDCEAIVMELVHGTTLRKRLDTSQTLPTDQAIAVGAQVADALDTAHRAGVVHRDIKPANILLSVDGRVMVADFGIAKAALGPDLTAEGSMLGTAKYLAPEQVEGTRVDGRTDLYALGVVLYEALTGRVPFLADTDTGTALARLHQAPLRPRQIRAEIPRSVEDVVMRAMARAPDDRYADAAQLRAALLACVSGQPQIVAPTDDTMVSRADDTPPPRDRTPVPPRAVAGVGDPSGEVEPPAGFGQSERAWLVPTLLIVLVAVALGVVGLLFGRSNAGKRLLGSSRAAATTTVPATPPKIASIRAFDPPPGDGVEDDQQLQNLDDGNPATTWHTETYQNAPSFGTKSGVGVRLTLDAPTKVSSLAVVSPSSGWSAQAYVSTGNPGNSLADWGSPVSSHADIAAGTTTFDLGGHRAAQVMLWITRLTDNGRVTIGELRLK